MGKIESIHISKDRKVLLGEAALEKLKSINDKKYFDPQRGVARIDKERWADAQTFESNTWLKDGRRSREDNNRMYRKYFDNYACLKGKKFDKAIELGAGPFTNARIISEVAEIKELHLLDPLIKSYLSHPHCTYKNNRLKVRTKIPFIYRKMDVKLHSSTIEEFSGEGGFDLIIIINVIEHCFDLNKIFEKILGLSKPGSFLVFYDKYFNEKELENIINRWYDCGHPLRAQGKIIQEFLDNNFTSLLKRIQYFKRYKRGMDASYNGLFYIGYKK